MKPGRIEHLRSGKDTKRISAAIAIGVVTLTASACSSSSTASTNQPQLSPNAAFLQEMHQAGGYAGLDDEALLQLGHGICNGVSEAGGFAGDGEVLNSDATQIALTNASIDHLCPTQIPAFNAWKQQWQQMTGHPWDAGAAVANGQ